MENSRVCGKYQYDLITASGVCSFCENRSDGTCHRGQTSMWSAYRVCACLRSFGAGSGRKPQGGIMSSWACAGSTEPVRLIVSACQ